MTGKDQALGTPETARLVRRYVCLAENAKFLRTLPAFSVNRKLPSRIEELICDLDEAERRAEQ